MGWIVALPFWAALLVVNKRVNVKGGGGGGGFGKGGGGGGGGGFGKGGGGGGGGFKGKDVVAVITMSLAFITGTGLTFTFIGRWTAVSIHWVSVNLSQLTSQPGLVRGIPIGITVLMVLIAIADIAFDRKADKGAQYAAMIMPTLLVLVVSGSLGETGGGAVNHVYDQMTAFVNNLGSS